MLGGILHNKLVEDDVIVPYPTNDPVVPLSVAIVNSLELNNVISKEVPLEFFGYTINS
jgi:hypothetical protein